MPAIKFILELYLWCNSYFLYFKKIICFIVMCNPSCACASLKASAFCQAICKSLFINICEVVRIHKIQKRQDELEIFNNICCGLGVHQYKKKRRRYSLSLLFSNYMLFIFKYAVTMHSLTKGFCIHFHILLQKCLSVQNFHIIFNNCRKSMLRLITFLISFQFSKFLDNLCFLQRIISYVYSNFMY